LANAIISGRPGNVRPKHLYNHLDAAKEKEDEEAAKQILAIIQHKKDKGFWRRMSYSLGN
jgi:hypothetical protein